MALGQMAHLGRESSLVRRRVCPLSTHHHPQRTTHSAGQHFPEGGVFAGARPAGRCPPLAVPPAAAGARPVSAPSQPAEQQPPAHGLQGTLPYNETDYVEVGKVVGAHGVRGELRLELYTDQPDKRFRAGKRLYLLPPPAQGPVVRSNTSEALPLIQVTSRGCKCRPLGKGVEAWLVALGELSNRSQAESLRGHLVLCAAADRDQLRDPDEFYVTDIIGCTVLDKASRRMLGQVVDVFSGMGTHDTLRVKLRATEEDIMQSRIRYVLIPFVRAICPVLDLPGRSLEVSPPEGLLELTSAERMKKPLSDAAKVQKLAQLREVRAREELEQATQQQQQQEKGEAGEEGEEEEGEEAAGAAAKAGAESGRVRRPGLRRRAGSLRLGRRRE